MESNNSLDKIFALIVRLLHPYGQELSDKEVEKVVLKWINMFFTVLSPFAGYLGYTNYKEIDSENTFWFFVIFGAVLIILNLKVLKNVLVYDPISKTYIEPRTKKIITKQRLESDQSIMRGIGLGLIAHGIGGSFEMILTYKGLIVAIISGIIFIRGLIKNIQYLQP